MDGGGGLVGSYDCRPPRREPIALTTEIVVDRGLTEPLGLEVAPGDDQRLFVVEKGGRIKVVLDGELLATPFLDLSAFVWTATEGGLLGLAFHPDYDESGRFFVYYTRQTTNGAHLVEFRRSADDPNVADPVPTHDEPLLELPLGAVHLGGSLRFGPDGFLYLSNGERGSVPEAAQDDDALLGKLLRIDVSEYPYAIPPENAALGAPEVLHKGLRNPWRTSHDPCTGDLYIGDVGNVSWEEIDFAPVGSPPLNFGWPIFEGPECFQPGPSGCDVPGLTAPLIAHSHGDPDFMSVVIGGFVYRGSSIPTLRGTYVYGSTGGVFGLRHERGVVTEWLDFTGDVDITLPVSFGQDNHGELYVVDLVPGRISRIVAAR